MNKVVVVNDVDLFVTDNNLDYIISNEYKVEELLNDFENKKKLGLLVGQVQSGKTRHVIKIIQTALTPIFNYNFVIYLGGTNSALWQQSYDRVQKEVSHKVYSDVQDFNGENKAVFVIMKEKTALQKMKQFVANNSFSKILIIDDESDYGSVNTKEFLNPSKINGLIHETYKLMNDNGGGILLVTATPFANLKNNRTDKFIDFVWTSPINKEYTGLDFFDGIDEEFYIDNINWIYKNYNNQFKLNPEKMYVNFGILIWILNSILYHKNEKFKPTDLLIYLSDDIEDHKRYKDYATTFLENLKLKSFNPLIEKFLLDFSNNQVSLEEFKSFVKDKIDILLFHRGDNTDNDVKKYSEKSSLSNHRIIIGGVFLSRGFTYETFLTEVFLNLGQQKNVDTLLQKCRWFGYRKTNNQYKYMNVITDLDIHDAIKKSVRLNSLFTEEPNGAKLDVVKLTNLIVNLEEELNIKGTSNVKGK